MPSPIPDGTGRPSLPLHRYGIGVDCHSRFFQVCILIPQVTEILRIERDVPALWPELRSAQAWVLQTLIDRGIDIPQSDLRYTCELTGQYHMPLCLAWRGHPAIINPSDTGHVRRKTDRLDAEKLAQHSLCGLWRESWMAPDEIQELRVLANQRSKLVAERSRLTNRINSDLLRFGHVVGQLGKINGSLVRALIEDFCVNGSVALHRDHFSDARIPAGVVRVLDQRWKRVDALDQEIKTVEDLCLKRADGLTWRIGAGQTAPGCQLRSNLESIPGVGTQTVITWLAEVGDITRFGSVNKLLAYGGLDPSDRISAGKVTSTKGARGMPGCTPPCGTRRGPCSLMPHRASSRGGRGDTWGGTPEPASRKRSTRWPGGSARRCTIAISRMSLLMTRVIRPCSMSPAIRFARSRRWG